MALAALLTIQKNGETVKSVSLDDEALVGRAEGCLIRLEDRAISRQHALFRKSGDRIQVERRSEFAPLSVNGEEKSIALLKEGDVVSIGPYLVRISMPSEDSQAKSRDPSPEAQAVLPKDAPAEERVGSGTEPIPDISPAVSSPIDLGAADEDPVPHLGAEVGAEVGAAAAHGGAFTLDPPALGDELNVPSPQARGESLAPPGSAADPAASAGAGEGAGGTQLLGLPASSPVASSGSGLIQFDPPGDDVLNPSHASRGGFSIPEGGTKAAEPTKIISAQARLEVKLVFEEGQANVTEYPISKDEVSIGRGKDCDIILKDKRSSRKNAVILRSGLNFMIRDLDSANGTYVNGERVNEKDLSGNDRILIGDTEFTFKAEQAGYAESEREFLPLPAVPAAGSGEDEAVHHSEDGIPSGSGEVNPYVGIAQTSGGTPAMGYIPGVDPALGSGPGGKPKGIIEKFKALPPRRRIIAIILVAAFIWLFLDDDEVISPVKKANQKGAKVAQVEGASGSSGDRGTISKDAQAAFAALSAEQKRFVESQHDLAFSLFQRKEYDRSIDEISKIFTLVPDYKDSREIERYAREGKRRMDAALEERKKQEEAEALKKQIAVLVNEAGDKMHAKKYDEARDIFSRVLSLDPENKAIAGWQHDLQELDEERRIQAQKKMVQEEVNQQAWALYRKGLAARREGKPQGAIEIFANVGKIESIDRRPATLSKRQIDDIHEEIQQKLAPLLAEAKQADDAQDYVKALQGYEAVLKIEASNEGAAAAIDRIRGILHEHAKVIFTEAIIAESYSDFATAKKDFTDCVKMAPDDDLYHSRCERKLARYFKLGGDSGFGGADGSGGAPP